MGKLFILEASRMFYWKLNGAGKSSMASSGLFGNATFNKMESTNRFCLKGSFHVNEAP